MKITDMFGTTHNLDKTKEQDYQDHINSPKWKGIREAKIKSVGEKCERCGISKWSAKLNVHHLTYKHFKNERMSELEVLCPACHASADEVREITEEQKRPGKALYRGFENWMDRGNNGNWRDQDDGHLAAEWRKFLAYLEHNTGREYDIPYWRSPNW